jgi:hypothetical protein
MALCAGLKYHGLANVEHKYERPEINITANLCGNDSADHKLRGDHKRTRVLYRAFNLNRNPPLLSQDRVGVQSLLVPDIIDV